MSGAAVVQLRKEFRALTPVWALGTLTLVGATLINRFPFDPTLAVGLYTVVAVALGALSIGQEFGWRTAEVLLVQPATRATVAGRKFVVLAALLVLFGAIFLTAMALAWRWPGQPAYLRTDVWLLPLLAGLFVAPWLTMWSRSTVGGLIFTLSAGFALWLGGGLVTRAVYGEDLPLAGRLAASAFHLAFYQTSALIACGLGAFLGWRAFQSLDARDTSFVTKPIASWWPTPLASSASRPRSRTRRSPLIALLRKELHLQQGTMAVAAFYCVVVVLIAVTTAPVTTEELFSTISIIYIGFVALIAGSLTSAEERQVGTLDTQFLLPLGRRTQWTVKIVAAVTVAIGAIVLAVLLETRLSPTLVLDGRNREVIGSMLAFLLTFAVGVYASSASQGSVRAMILAAALGIGAGYAWWQVILPLTIVGTRGMRGLTQAAFGRTSAHNLIVAYQVIGLAAWAILAAMLLKFAYENHWAPLPTKTRVLRQVSLLAAVMLVVSLVMGSLP